MADSTLEVASVFLISGRFGPPSPHEFGGMLDGITGSSHHNVASAEFDVGTVVSMINKGTTSGSREGMTEFVYGQYVTQSGGPAMAVGQTAIVVPNGGGNALHTFTNYADYSSGTSFLAEAYNPFGVICISVMTGDRYGWFWCGGVAPEDFVTPMTGTVIITSNSVVAGVFCTEDVSATGILGIGPYHGSVATSAMLQGSTGVEHYVPMGYTLADDQ